MALRDTASGHGAGRLGLEIDNLSGLFQPQCSMKAEGCVNVHESQKTQKRKQSCDCSQSFTSCNNKRFIWWQTRRKLNEELKEIPSIKPALVHMSSSVSNRSPLQRH